MGFEAVGRHAAGPLMDRELAEVLEARPNPRLEDLFERPRLGIDHDQGFGHQLTPMRFLPLPFGQDETTPRNVAVQLGAKQRA
jgi:hypothetical protein